MGWAGNKTMTDYPHPIIVWFRQDLRLRDNLAFIAAVETRQPVLPIYILDDENADEWAMGGASRWWLHHSLTSLNKDLNGLLRVYHGDASAMIDDIINDTNAKGVYWNRCYEPWRIARDKKIKVSLKEKDIDAQSFNGSLLFEPHAVLKEDGTPYKVFTPFYRKGCLERNLEPPKPQDVPDNILFFNDSNKTHIDDLKLLPIISWDETMRKKWMVGEQGAQDRLAEFLDEGISNYKEDRNHPAQNNVSRLSPYLHFGEISPRDVWHAAKASTMVQGLEKDGDHFLSEIGWREFSNNLLYHFPDLPHENLQKKFNAFPWRDDPKALKEWQKGVTGYPLDDAGMRELWQTGYMHNRVRMIVGSFLVKNLLLHWHHGEDWFWDTLVDADLANNSASWQWIAGCGADAAPYFRVFNPVTQGQKFDKEGEYIRKYIPEIAMLPDKYLNCPWDTPQDILDHCGIVLDDTYPKPIVDLKVSRERALNAFQSLKEKV
jgi:deoxyribodipyrimidine photo-lyase